MNKEDILIVCALEIETQEKLNDWDPFADDPVWNILYTGVGKVNATYELTKYLTEQWETHRCRDGFPKLIINYGTAGSQKIKKKTLVDCTKFVQRDMDVTGLGFMEGQTPFEPTVPIILDYDHVEFNPIGKKLRCGTGDNFVKGLSYAWYKKQYGDVIDMEAYALAKVCYHYKINFISFKYITDGADENADKDWEENLADGILKFKKKVLDLLD